ncbi:uncharacterized protein LOC122647481 [Telopea speciosissima]|uniref:uncharacterized protein LOC122647481 n=1 Tax=Telopea speciosissima TaxID=54955 RepID=UPI001CC4F3D4|nr:uncharacterized protein LOC122647481 [Telopea speciosissima]
MDEEQMDGRNNNLDCQFSFPRELDDNDALNLSLSLPTTYRYTPPSPPPLSPAPPLPPLPPSYPLLYLSSLTVDPSLSPFFCPANLTCTTFNSDPSTSTSSIACPEPCLSRNLRTRRRNPTQAQAQAQAQRQGQGQARPGRKTETIPIPYQWATNRRATVHNLEHLLSIGIQNISGEVQCKRCERKYEIEYDLKSKFIEIASFIAVNKSKMHDRAPKEWMNPLLPTCKYCEQVNSVKPIIADKKKEINWLFLLLGQMLGCCTLDQLKYFCKHTKNHRTGAKDRVLYLTYLALCKQLDHVGPFDR